MRQKQFHVLLYSVQLLQQILEGKLSFLGLFFLSLGLISGFSIQTVFSANLILKAIFTFVAWFIYVITIFGIKYLNFPMKYATRSLFIAMWAVLGAYYMNSYIIGS